MTSRSVVVSLPQELDTNMAKLVQLANNYSARVYLSYGSRRINAKSIMGMMSLALASGDSVSVEAEGSDEAEAVNAISNYLS